WPDIWAAAARSAGDGGISIRVCWAAGALAVAGGAARGSSPVRDGQSASEAKEHPPSSIAIVAPMATKRICDREELVAMSKGALKLKTPQKLNVLSPATPMAEFARMVNERPASRQAENRFAAVRLSPG